jgi:hypothetical protein
MFYAISITLIINVIGGRWTTSTMSSFTFFGVFPLFSYPCLNSKFPFPLSAFLISVFLAHVIFSTPSWEHSLLGFQFAFTSVWFSMIFLPLFCYVWFCLITWALMFITWAFVFSSQMFFPYQIWNKENVYINKRTEYASRGIDWYFTRSKGKCEYIFNL